MCPVGTWQHPHWGNDLTYAPQLSRYLLDGSLNGIPTSSVGPFPSGWGMLEAEAWALRGGDPLCFPLPPLLPLLLPLLPLPPLSRLSAVLGGGWWWGFLEEINFSLLFLLLCCFQQFSVFLSSCLTGIAQCFFHSVRNFFI